jgi:hypothetical protein
LEEPLLINGSFLGEIKASINKKDMDIGVTLYELMPNGECHNKIETIPFSNTHLVSR